MSPHWQDSFIFARSLFYRLIFSKYVNCDDSSSLCLFFFILLEVTEKRHQKTLATQRCHIKCVYAVGEDNFPAFSIHHKNIKLFQVPWSCCATYLERILILQCISIWIKISVSQMGFGSQMKIVLETISTLNMQNKGLF